MAHATTDCLVIGFYFLLHPGEYTGCPRGHNNLFRLHNVQVWLGSCCLDPILSPSADRQAATFVTLTFTSQIYGVCGETLGHARSGHRTLCALSRLVTT
jgi:hypothetical protein